MRQFQQRCLIISKQKTGDAAKRLRADFALSGSPGGLFKTSVEGYPRPTRRSNPRVKHHSRRRRLRPQKVQVQHHDVMWRNYHCDSQVIAASCLLIWNAHNSWSSDDSRAIDHYLPSLYTRLSDPRWVAVLLSGSLRIS